MSRYAEDTKVPEERSRGEIEKTLGRYGATGFMYGWQGGYAVVAFELYQRRVRFDLPMPTGDEEHIRKTPTGRARSPSDIDKALQQEKRRRWRALALVVKSKLEAVETGIVTFEEEFLAHIVLPNGQRVGGWAVPQIQRAYETGEMPALLPAPGGDG